GQALCQRLSSRYFRPYYSYDIIGAQLGGAVKNVLAIACGIVEGKGMGDNARAALITRGLAEIARLGLVLGADERTLMGLSGLGDLTLTCNAMQSRNFSLGVALGQGRSLQEILAERKSVTEGVYTAAAVTEVARREQVDMPICQAVDAVLNLGADLDAVISGLLTRPLNIE
ncbi:MAG TPA: NAD(P)H-dependent glycerol-3-phosphate dehydrogenase, partial [Magnetovibrio sp.]